MFTGIGNVNEAPRAAPPEERRVAGPKPPAWPKRDADVVELGAEMPTPGVYAQDASPAGRWKGSGGSTELPEDLKALLSLGAGSGLTGETAQEAARLIAEVIDRLAANREQDVARVREAVEEWHAREAKGEAGAQELIRLLREALASPADLPLDA